jgi:5S rRNA maturation endonuclease (ribonuclease M5)
MPDRLGTDADARGESLARSVADALRAIRGAQAERAEARHARLTLAAIHGATRLRRVRES